MTSTTVAQGDEANLSGADPNGNVWWLLVQGGDIRLSLSRNYVSDGLLIEQDYVARVAQPAGEELNVRAVGSNAADLELSKLADSSPASHLQVSLQPRRTLEISGTVTADVSDRSGRNVGKARLMDSAGALIDPATETTLSSVVDTGGANPVFRTDQQGPVSIQDSGLSTVDPHNPGHFEELHDNATGTGAAAAADVDTPRTYHSNLWAVFVDVSGGATVTVEAEHPVAGTTSWAQYDTVSYSGATTDVIIFRSPFERHRAYVDANLNHLVLSTRGA